MEKLSFRQVGKNVQGSMKRGIINNAYTKQNTASIPTKFETVLYADHRHTKGFGSRSHRFTQVVEDIPGPGQYSQQIPVSEESISKKGYGNGFLSKNQRFKLFQYNTVAPGPGTYSSDSLLSTQSSREKTAPSSMFIQPSSNSLSAKQMMPGPGQYNPQIVNQIQRSASAAFKSTSNRIQSVDRQKIVNPAPWQYNPENFDKIKEPQRGYSSSFKPPLNARRYQINLYDPHAKMPQEVENNPGPGQYDNNFEIYQKEENWSQPSSMFVLGQADRFGNASQSRRGTSQNPGPGQYNTLSIIQEKQPISSSVFMSETLRGSNFKRKPPGPAFYRPVAVPKKRSFHLNTKKLWV